MVGIPPKTLLAFMLDPRFKNLPYVPQQDHARLWSMLQDELVTSIEKTEQLNAATAAAAPTNAVIMDVTSDTEDEAATPAAPAPSAAAASDGIDWDAELAGEDDFAPARAASEAAADTEEQLAARRILAARAELRTYKQMERLRHAPPTFVGDPLAWWRDTAATLPHLSNLARKLLCIPATSASSERIFSSAGHTITARRARLTSENASMILFLRGSYEKVREFSEMRERRLAAQQRQSPAKKRKVVSL
jgi:hypothetical protein